jgi:hypothetical protein
MERVWRNLCCHLRSFPLSVLRGKNGSVDQIALDFLAGMTHGQTSSMSETLFELCENRPPAAAAAAATTTSSSSFTQRRDILQVTTVSQN